MMMTRQRRTRRRRRLNRPRNHHFPITLKIREIRIKRSLYFRKYACAYVIIRSLSLSVKAPDDKLPPSSLLNQPSQREQKQREREKKSEESNCIPRRRRRRRERGNTKKHLGFDSVVGFRVATHDGNKKNKKSGRKRLQVRWSVQK